MPDKTKEASDRVKLNLLTRYIGAISNDQGPEPEITSRGVGLFQVVLYGKRANLIFVGTFADCHAYLYGVRDMVTAGG